MLKKIHLLFLIVVLAFVSSCGGSLSFQKESQRASISYEELEAVYLENYPQLQEPIVTEDQKYYEAFKVIIAKENKNDIKVSLNVIEEELSQTTPSDNRRNLISLYMLVGQMREVLLADPEAAKATYKKIWQQFQATQFLHPYFDPEKKELTNEWYILHSDAEAILKTGHILKKQGKLKDALLCYKRVLRYYGNALAGAYSLDFPDRYGRVVTAEIVKLEPVTMPDVELVRSYSGDRLTEFTKLAEKFPETLLRGDRNQWVGFVSYGGVMVGEDQAEKKWTDHKVCVYQLINKTGPQYETLFGWIKELKAQASEVRVSADRTGNELVAVLSHPNSKDALRLYFRAINSIWYMTGLYLY